MASQVFWLLSYVSLGLALTLGNRPTSIHSSQQQQQQQQQKQQSTSSSSSSSSSSSASSSSSSSSASSSSSPSSSQAQKSRSQDHRFSRDPTIVDVANELSPPSGPEDQLDRLRSYRYEEPVELDDELTRDWLEQSDKPWRDPSTFFRRREHQLDEDERRDGKSPNVNGVNGGGGARVSSNSRGNAFLDEFATAVLDTLYPRHRDHLVPAKPPNIRSSYDQPRRYDHLDDNGPIIAYAEMAQQQQQQQPRGSKKLRISTSGGQHEFPRKITRAPLLAYRTDQPEGLEEAPLAITGKMLDIDRTEEQRLLVPRTSGLFVDGPRSSSGWLGEPLEYSSRNNEIKSRSGDYAYDGVASSSSSSSSSSGTSSVASGKPPGKRNQGGGGGGRGRSSNPRGWSPGGQQSQAAAASNAGASIASQFLLRSARGNRQYDVPQIECPASEDGMERFACPTPDRMGRYRCIDDHVLCDGFIDCPAAEDEDRQDCMFYKTTKAHLDVLADALLRWARGR